jgi:integrase
MIDPSNLAKEFATHTEKAGLGHRNLHQLRHSAATIMLAQGVPLYDVSRVLGHSTISVTSDVYGHFSKEMGRLAADAMTTALWGDGSSLESH